MMLRGTRRSVLLVLAALLPALPACYEYVPLATSTAPVGETVTLQINDQGRVALADRFGAGLSDIEGRVVSHQDNEYVINVYRVSQISGESAQWSGETTRLNASYIGLVKGREFSATRTTVAAVVGVGALGLLLAGQHLIGSFSGSSNDPVVEKPASLRIPLKGLFFTRHPASIVEDFWR